MQMTDEELLALAKKDKIQAIKEYRESTGAGLADAKNYIDNLLANDNTKLSETTNKSQTEPISNENKNSKSHNGNKTIRIVIGIVLILIGVIWGISNGVSSASRSSSNKTTTQYSTYNQTTKTTTTEETTVNTNATSYIPSSREVYELLKPVFLNYGYDFDEWVVNTNTDEKLILQGSTDQQAVIISENYATISVSQNQKVMIFYDNLGNFESASIYNKTSGGINVYEICDVILSKCPDEFKLDEEYINTNYNNVVQSGCAQWEKNELVYTVRKMNNGGNMISLACKSMY
jgi:hypothetical protein